MREERKIVNLTRFIWAILAMVVLLFPSGTAPDAVARVDKKYHPTARPSHAGELLVASPSMRDPRFKETVILLVRHDESGAFGLIVNRVVGSVKVSEILKRLRLEAPESKAEIVVHYGGPVQPEAGFVLYSTDFKFPHTYRVSDKFAVTTNAAILRNFALGNGPRQMMFALGYSGWGAGQLESEMRRGAWYTAPAEEDILFDENHHTKWTRAVKRRFRTL